MRNNNLKRILTVSASVLLALSLGGAVNAHAHTVTAEQEMNAMDKDDEPEDSANAQKIADNTLEQAKDDTPTAVNAKRDDSLAYREHPKQIDEDIKQGEAMDAEMDEVAKENEPTTKADDQMVADNELKEARTDPETAYNAKKNHDLAYREHPRQIDRDMGKSDSIEAEMNDVDRETQAENDADDQMVADNELRYAEHNPAVALEAKQENDLAYQKYPRQIDSYIVHRSSSSVRRHVTHRGYRNSLIRHERTIRRKLRRARSRRHIRRLKRQLYRVNRRLGRYRR